MKNSLKPIFLSVITLLSLATTACNKKDVLHWLQDDDKNSAQSATAGTATTTGTAGGGAKTSAKPLSDSRKEQLVNDLAGVWQSGRDLIIMNRVGGKFQLLIGDRFLPVTIGDIDPDNKTVNLLFSDKSTGKKIIWTVKKVMADDNKSYHLRLTSNTGEKFDLEFVRKVGTDDLNHIEELAPAKTNSNTRVPTDTAAQQAAATAQQAAATANAAAVNAANNANAAADAAAKEATDAAKQAANAASENSAKQSYDNARSQLNKLWNSATPEQKSQFQSEQEAWIAHRDSSCNSESSEVAKLDCKTRSTKERYGELKSALGK